MDRYIDRQKNRLTDTQTEKNKHREREMKRWLTLKKEDEFIIVHYNSVCVC